jgi:hypothetical protein
MARVYSLNYIVIPAKAGIHGGGVLKATTMDPGLRRDDNWLCKRIPIKTKKAPPMGSAFCFSSAAEINGGGG